MRDRIVHASLGLFCLLLSLFGYSQNATPYTAYNVKSSLQTNTIYGLSQDSKGFLWVGTDRGLIRYDGFEFKLYTNPAMAGSGVTKPQEDAFGRIWCINFYSQVFYVDNDTLKILPGVINNTMGYFEFNDKKDKLYLIQNRGGPLELDVKTLKSTKINLPKNFNTRLCCFYNNKLYIIDNDAEIARYSNGKLVTINADEIKKVNSSNYYILPLVINNKLFFFENSTQQLFLLKNDSLVSATHLLKNYDFKQYTNSYNFAPGKTFMSTNSGFYLFNNSDSITGPYFSDFRVSSIVDDNEGQRWVGTLDNGLLKVTNPNLGQCFNAVAGSIVCYTLGQNNTLWLGYNNGLVQELQLPGCALLNTYTLPEKRDVNQLLYDPVTGKMYAFQNGTYVLQKGVVDIIGMSLTKSAVIDGKNGMLYSASSDGVNQVSISPQVGIVKFADSLLVKGGSWVYMVDKGVEKFYYSVVKNSRGRCIAYDSLAGLFYAGHAKGLSAFSGQQQAVSITDNGNPVYATHLLYYKGKTWVTTVSSGVYVLQNNKIIKHLTIANGLNGNSVETLIPFGNKVWAAGAGFINPIAIDDFTISAISGSTGLLGNKSVGIVPVDDNKFLYISGAGIYNVDNSSLNRVMPAPRLYLMQSYLNDALIDITANNCFAHNQNNLRFNFTALQLSDPTGLVFYYKINDDEWVPLPQEQHSLSLTALTNGDYTLQLKAVNRTGATSNIVVIPFTIKPPFWRATWFLAVLAIVVLMGIYLLYRYNINRINKRNKLLNEKAGLEADVRASQLSALKVQMNPHFIFNALNSIQEFILTNEKKLANTYLGKFSDLMRITLDLSQEEYVHLNEELRALTLYLELENLRFSNEIECVVDTGNIQSPGKILIPPMLLQPFVENAIKHGLLHKKGVKKLFVSLSIEPEAKLLHCIIADNGIGRKKSGELKKFHPQKHKSFATSATAKRLELLNTGNKQKIRVEYTDLQSTNGDALGTRVELSIPYLET